MRKPEMEARRTHEVPVRPGFTWQQLARTPSRTGDWNLFFLGKRKDRQRATAHVLLITGSPGVGKTTIIQKVAAALSGRHLGGFYTEEIRADGERRGFRLVTFDGWEWTMAHVGIRGPHRVGKYGVDVAAVEQAATTALAAGRADLYLVDEIGKMECLSPGFLVALRRLLDSPATVVATVALHGDGFIAEVKQRANAEIWTVTRANRDDFPGRAVQWLRRA